MKQASNSDRFCLYTQAMSNTFTIIYKHRSCTNTHTQISFINKVFLSCLSMINIVTDWTPHKNKRNEQTTEIMNDYN